MYYYINILMIINVTTQLKYFKKLVLHKMYFVTIADGGLKSSQCFLFSFNLMLVLNLTIFFSFILTSQNVY